MAKLSQLLTLERMLDAYDMMHTNDAWIIEKHGVCTGELIDDIIAKLVRQLNSKTTLSCRNVLVANFETMTKTAYWLKCKLFGDLPKAMGKALREKIEQMVDLLKDLMVKIINVDEFAEEFLERLKNRYLKKRHTSDYELWKARQSKITTKRLVRYQVDLTAEMLSCGILKYAEAPNGEEIQNVDKDKLALTLTDKSKITETFINECAKLRRYSHWEGDMFVIDYELLRKYLYCMFGKLTSEQHIKMFEYDVQMKQIHEDMRKLMKEHEEDELKEEKEMKEKATEETQRVDNDKVQKLKPLFYNNEDNVKRFLKEIDSMPPNNITDLVNQWVKDKLISDYGNSRKGELWDILNKAGLYTKSRQNWNRRVF